jgi:hypothetical protein
MADIDLDFPDRKKVLDLIKHIPASQIQNHQRKKHNSGVYVTDIPYDPINNMAAIDYVEAEQRGYFKLDFLNMSVYNLIKDRDHYAQLLDTDPPWTKLWEDSEWARQLVHVGAYTDLLAAMKPDSITRMAAFISVIRPGKAHLQGRPWPEIFNSVWDGDDSRGFVFKKSHSISYSMLVALHMNLLTESMQ